MGYDMRWEKSPPPEFIERQEAARVVFEAAVAARDAHPRGSKEADELQVAVSDAYGEMQLADIGYFRFNIWALGPARDALYEAGVIVENEDPGEWPEPSEFGLDEWPDVQWDGNTQTWVDWDTREPITDEKQLAFLEKARGVRDHVAEGDATGGIPMYKLCTNDGWLVTPGEIVTGLALADRQNEKWRDELPDNDIRAFVQWMELARAFGGFRVH